MIVKIWPIKADYGKEKGKAGGAEGLKNAVEYVMDREKVMVSQDDIRDFVPYDKADVLDGSRINTDMEFDRVVSYMADEDKTAVSYISTYLCPNNNVAQDFQVAAELLALKGGLKKGLGTGAVAYHLVQSFPEHLDISNEEVHECGMDLVRRLGKYQALVCSHVHPVLDEKEEVHGRCKHNHILLNAYVHPDFYDPAKGGQGKYNDCIETYRQLQVYNDEVAIEHGLPIIRQADMERTYSWTESDEKNKGTSWKERVRMDIDMCRRVASNWDEFLEIMEQEGYTIREKKHITYTTPDGHTVRGGTLGHRFTKEALNLYWAVRDHAMEGIKQDLDINEEPILSDFVYHYNGKLSVRIPLGPQFTENRRFAYVPISKDTKANEEALRSYMAMDRLYDICNESGQPVAAVSGIEILRSIEDLKEEGRMKYREQVRMQEAEIREERRRREAKKSAEMLAKKQFHYNKNFRSSRNGRLYRSELYDENGRRRSMIELMFVLALIVMNKESYLWVPRGEVPKEQENEVFFASTNRKLQLIVDSIELSRQEGLDTLAQLEKRLNSVGAAYSRTKKGYYNTSRAAQRMEMLAEAVKTYRKTSRIIEGIDALPEGEEKEALRKQYADEAGKLKAARHVMHLNSVTKEEDIIDFEKRYAKICADVQELDARLKEHAEHYRRLKKLEYSLQLAQEPKFVYGPSYPGVGFQLKEQEEKAPARLWDKPGMQPEEREELSSEVANETESGKEKEVQKE